LEYRNRGIGAATVIVTVIILSLAAGVGAGYVFGPGSAASASSVTTTTITSTAVSTLTVSGLAPASSSSPTSAAIDAGQIYRSANASVVTVDGFVSQTYNTYYGPYTQVGEVLGSGFVMTYGNANYIVTNFHVVDGVTNMTVIFWNGHAYPAAVVGTDPYSDLAIVKVPTAPSSEFHPLALSSSSSVNVGDSVAAIGNPFGLSGSLTAGVISQLGRTVSETAAGNYSIAGVIQFSAPINPGNSGGPLFNVNGQVIGLTTATVSGSQGVGFAIPSDAVSREIGSLVANGTYRLHPYLGISTADMFYQLAQANGNNVTYGVLVESLVTGGPAASAGVKAGTTQATIEGQNYLLGGDVIVSVNGTQVINHDALASYLEGKAVPGHTLMLGIVRGTTLMSVPLTIGARPSAPSTLTSSVSTV
jgi:S1-C subfamily serine protease